MTEHLLIQRLEAAGARCRPLRYARGGGHTRALVMTTARPEPPRGRVVFAHATGNDALFPQLRLFTALVDAGLEVMTFDLDGHGRASTTQLDPRTLPGAVAAAVDAAGWGRDPAGVHLVGQSLGAALCLAAAAGGSSAALAVRSLTLLSTPLTLSLRLPPLLAELRSLTRAALWASVADYGAWGLVPALGAFKRGAFPLRLADTADTRRDCGDYLRVVARLLVDLDLEAQAAAVAAPTLLVYGGADRIAPPAHGVRLARALPQATLRVFAGETHFTTGLGRDVCDDEVARFVREKRGP